MENNFVLTITNNISQYLTDDSIASGIGSGWGNSNVLPGSPPIVIPNQCWRGYWQLDTFNSTANKPANIQFKDFGISVWYHACGICCCLGAANQFYGTQLTMFDAWSNGLFVWKPGNDKYGRKNGAMLAKFPQMTKIGIKTDTQATVYDIGREYSWCKKSSAYGDTSSVLQDALDNAWYDNLYEPTTSDTDLYKSYYNQANGAYTQGTLSQLFSDSQKSYRAMQVAALKRIEEDVAQNKFDIIYFSSPKHNSGHYVLAVGYQHKHGNNVWSVDDVTVWDPCPVSTQSTDSTEVYNNKIEYYGREMSLIKSMLRCNDDISDGIRTVQTVTKIN